MEPTQDARQGPKTGRRRVIATLVAQQDVRAVCDIMAAQYDMYVSEQFAADLIAFVEALTDAQPRG